MLTLLSSVFAQYRSIEGELGVNLEDALAAVNVATQSVSPTANSCQSLGYLISLAGPSVSDGSFTAADGWDAYLMKMRDYFAR